MATAAFIERRAVGVLGVISGLIVAGVPWCTAFRQIRAAGDVGGRTVFPYATTWINAFALVVYAWPKNDWEVVVVNILAFGLESMYCYWYIRHSAGWNRIIAYVMLAIQLIFAVVLLLLQFVYFDSPLIVSLNNNSTLIMLLLM